MKQLKLLYIFLIFLFSSCGSSPTTPTEGFSLDTDTYVTVGDSERVLKNKGKIVPYADQPILFESPGKISLMVYRTSATSNTTSIKLREMNRAETSMQLRKLNNQVLEEVLAGVQNSQMQISKKNASAALDIVNELIRKYPELSYLKFLKASCHTIMGQKQMAIDLLKETLKEHPNNKQANDLYESLISSSR